MPTDPTSSQPRRDPAAIQVLRDQVYASPLPSGLRVEACDAATYWRLHEQTLRPMFPPEVYFAVGGSEATEPDAAIIDYLLLRDGTQLAGVTSGYATAGSGTYHTFHTSLAPAYRGRGVYRELQRRVITYTRDAGFRVIASEHAPSNNAALITKLRSGFRIVGMEIDPGLGPTIKLRYFHDPDEDAVYLYRNGLARLTPALIRSGWGAMSNLREQFRAAEDEPLSG